MFPHAENGDAVDLLLRLDDHVELTKRHLKDANATQPDVMALLHGELLVDASEQAHNGVLVEELGLRCRVVVCRIKAKRSNEATKLGVTRVLVASGLRGLRVFLLLVNGLVLVGGLFRRCRHGQERAEACCCERLEKLCWCLCGQEDMPLFWVARAGLEKPGNQETRRLVRTTAVSWFPNFLVAQTPTLQLSFFGGNAVHSHFAAYRAVICKNDYIVLHFVSQEVPSVNLAPISQPPL